MNYLERLIDEKSQLQHQIKRAEKAVIELNKKDEELAEIIEHISQLERYQGVEVVEMSRVRRKTANDDQ